MEEVFIRRIPLPGTVRGLAVINRDGDYLIFINDSLSEEAQRLCAAHELAHLKAEHFRGDASVGACEQEARECQKMGTKMIDNGFPSV